MMALL
jgi:hypothetical protein